MKIDHAQREVENGFRQFDRCLDIVEYYLDPERPFALRSHIILELQKEAVEGIESQAGKLRTAAVGISKSEHTPPPPHLVESLVRDFCEYINDNWHEKNAFHLAAYAMWRAPDDRLRDIRGPARSDPGFALHSIRTTIDTMTISATSVRFDEHRM